MHISPAITIGFHGCSRSTADMVLTNRTHLTPSTNDYDWLGHGIYFWEGSLTRAQEWADKNFGTDGAVVGAFIHLGNCLDLLDTRHTERVKNTYDLLIEESENSDIPLAKNYLRRDGEPMIRNLDCQVMLFLQELNNQAIRDDLNSSDLHKVQHHPSFIDSVRGMFPEGKDLYADAGFKTHNHIQLCIINPNCIIGYFDPTLEVDDSFKSFYSEIV